MPYVKAERRNIWLREKPTTPGDLNFDITSLLLDYVAEHGLNYDTINAIGGALSYADKEFYRRVVVPYEQGAIERNGDIFPAVGEIASETVGRTPKTVSGKTP